jgi:hypothetical protein
MLQVARSACLAVLLAVFLAGCGDEPPRSKKPTTSTSVTSTTPATSTTPPVETATPSATPTASSTDRLSGIATRTGFTIIHEGNPIDAAGLQAIGWTIDAATGSAHWSDPALGEISVTWEIPDERAIFSNDTSFWGDVTGANLAMNPSMYAGGGFTGGPIEATAHSNGGVRAEAPTTRLRVAVPERPVGTSATVNINLGFPVPVLVTYNYVYI